MDKPKEKLWIATKDLIEVRHIFDHIKSLDYKDRPNYELIRNNLKSIMAKDEPIPNQLNGPLGAELTQPMILMP